MLLVVRRSTEWWSSRGPADFFSLLLGFSVVSFFWFFQQWHTNSTALLTDCLVFASSSSVLFTGVDFKIKTVELRGKKIRLQIWDTAGQERFNSITSAYYRSAKGIILVYDITKKETFDDLPKWMKMIDKYASEDAELLLVGNKLDCETDREISRQQGEKFAQQIAGMRFCEASAKDNFNVDEIFLKLVDDILKKMPLDMLRNELSNSILSLQPEPEIPPELPPPRPHVRCC